MHLPLGLCKVVHAINQLDILKDAAKFLIGTAAGWAWKITYDRWKTRKARSFWRPFLSKDLRIVLGRFGQFDSFERSGLLGVGDAIAVSELQGFLGTMGFAQSQVVYADRVSGDDLKHPLILLGGPDANEITHQASKLFHTTLRFGDPSINEIAFRDASTKPPQLYIPIAPTVEQAGSDFGLIFRVPNPFAGQEPALIIAGSFGYGTWAAARYVISSKFLESEAAEEPALECLIKTTVVRETPLQIEAVITRALR